MTTATTISETRCYHCGDLVIERLPQYDGKSFCCEGCKLVFELLQENGLCNYYQLEETPGIKIIATDQGDKYAFLENPEVQQAIVDVAEGGVSRVQFFIPQIHCSSCIWLLESLPRLHQGIVRASVDLVRKTVTLSYREADLDLRRTVELLATIGYAPSLTMDRATKVPVRKVDRSLYYKIGIAGFCFGNIMLLSFPEYLTGGGHVEADLKRVFSYLQFTLALPVFFYSASDYFRGAMRGLKGRTVNIDVPITMGVLALFLWSSYEIMSGRGAGYMDSLAGLVFFLLIGKWYQAHSYRALAFDRDHRSYFPMAVRRLRGQEEESIPIGKVEKGDRILVRNNELVPADAILVKGVGNIDHSFITGEPVPVTKKVGEQIHAGGKQLGASIEVEVLRPMSDSYLAELWSQDVFNKEVEAPLATSVDGLAKYFTIAVIVIALCTLCVWAILDSSIMWSAFTAVLIVACPCALALTIPFTYGHAMRVLGGQGLFMKNANITGAFTDLDVAVFDKTGTLSEMGTFEVEFVGKALNGREQDLLRNTVRHSTHPFSRAVYVHLNKGRLLDVERSEEVPGEGIRAVVSGIELRVGSYRLAGRSAPAPNEGPQVHCSIAGTYRGYFSIREKLREDVDVVVGGLRKDMKVYLVSGDQKPLINGLQPLCSQLEKMFPKMNMYFGQRPIDKLQLVRGLQEQGHKVLMVGDGLNDAGALKQANVGMAVADDHSSFTPASDAIIGPKALLRLPRLLTFAKSMRKVVLLSLIISLLYNLVGLSFAVRGELTPLVAAILMPLSSVSVVAFIALAVAWRARAMQLLEPKKTILT